MIKPKVLQKNIREVCDFNGFKQTIAEKRGFVKAYWCGSAKCEKTAKEKTGATLRCIPFSEKPSPGKCIVCNKDSDTIVYFARAY